MAGRYVSEIELKTNIEKVLANLKETQDRVNKLEGKEYKVNLDIDTKTLESAIQKLDKMLDSLGKGTGDFKQFENLSKELSVITSEVQSFSKAFGKVDDSGTKTLLSSIQNIDKSLSELSQNILNVNKNMGNIGGNTNGAVKQVENIGNAAADAAKQVDKLAEAQNKLGSNKTNISLGDSSTATSNADVEIKTNSEVIASIEKKKQELASYELQLEETRYELDKFSKAQKNVTTSSGDLNAHKLGIKMSMLDSTSNSMKTNPSVGLFGNKDEVLQEYNLYNSILEKLGYKLSEIKKTAYGGKANILPIDEKAISDANELSKAIDNISIASTSSDNIQVLNQQISELESKISSLKSEISSLESVSNNTKKDAFLKTDDPVTNTSVSAIKEENNAFEQTTQSAEKAANSKKKFANANKEVKDSVNASVGAIKDENNAFDQNEWDKNVKAIQKYMDAVTELNNLKAKDKGTGKNASVIAYQEKEVERLKNIAYEAKETLSSIANSNKADVNTWEKWVNVMKQFDQASQGSTRSIARLEDAMRNANNSQIEYMNSVIKRFQNSYDKYSTDASRNGYNPSVEFSDKLSSFNSSLNDLKNLSNSISNGEFVKQEQIDSFKRLTQNAEEAQKALKNMSASEKGMKSVSIQKEIDKINQLLRDNTNYCKEAKIELRSLITQLMSGDPTVNLEAIHTKVMEIKNAEELAGRAGKNFFDILASKSYYGFIGQMQSYLSMYVGFYGMMNSFKNISSAVVQLNSDITELSKVSEATYEQIYNDFDSYADIAKEIGGTISDTISATADWSRNGYNIPDSKELARVALLYKNVGDGIDIDTANESLISTLRGFKMEADEAEKIIDIFNNVSNNEPIDSGGIGEALQRSAASFNAANTSLQESVALISTTNSVIQNPEKVGNMWKVVSMRIRSATSELQEAGEDTDGIVESTADLQKMIKAMTGYDILESDGKTFKSIYDIVLNISKVWDSLSDLDQSSLLQALAGKQQSNALAAALGNPELLEKSYKEAMESAGSAAEEERKYQESIQYSIDQTKAKLEELANDTLNSDFLKGAIDAGGKLIDILDGIVKSGNAIPTMMAGITAALSFNNIGKYYVSA